MQLYVVEAFGVLDIYVLLRLSIYIIHKLVFNKRVNFKGSNIRKPTYCRSYIHPDHHLKKQTGL